MQRFNRSPLDTASFQSRHYETTVKSVSVQFFQNNSVHPFIVLSTVALKWRPYLEANSYFAIEIHV